MHASQEKLGKPIADEKRIISYAVPGGIYLPLQSRGLVKHEADERTRKKPNSTTILFRIREVLESPEIRLARRTVEAVSAEGAEDAWFSQLPCRLGQSAAMDASVNSVVLASQYRRHQAGATERRCFQSLVTAIQSVQATINKGGLGDDVLAATACLALFEARFNYRSNRLERSHLKGMVAIMASRPKNERGSDFARRILQYFAVDIYVLACVRGIPSPLEDVNPSYYRPQNSKGSAGCRLRALGNEVYVFLPRLNMAARSARIHQENDSELSITATMIRARELILQLLELKDDFAENEILHTVNVRPTQSSDDREIVKYSFDFHDAGVFETITKYWHARASLLRLCLHLLPHFRAWDGQSEAESPMSLPSSMELSLMLDLQRQTRNLMMSIQYSQADFRCLGPRSRMRFYAHIIVTMWGVIQDAPTYCPVPSSQGGVPLMKGWLLSKARAMLAGSSVFSAKDMDQASEIYVGGDLEGAYVEIH
jgi:hypothetical protein